MAPRSLRLPLLLILAALVAAPAAAHSEATTQLQTFEIGPYYASIEPSPMPLYANVTEQAFILSVANASTNKFVRADAVGAKAEIYNVGGRESGPIVMTFEPVDERTAIGKAAFPASGSFPMRVTFTSDGQSWSKNLFFKVYPDVPFRIRPVDAEQDVLPDVTSTLRYEIVDKDDPARRVDALADLRMRVEHWSPDHQRLLDAVEVPLRKDGPGLWTLEHRFGQGHYYLRFASDDGGFNYTDLPLLHTNVLPTYDDGGEARKAPIPSAGSALAALALAGLALARRRG